MTRRLPVVLALALSLVLLGAAALFGYNRHQANRNMARNSTALIALCALRHDLDMRIASSEDLLVKYPHGFAGIPAAVIRSSVENSKRTRVTLNVLDCPPDVAPQFP
jgi:hypothetical protein